MIRVLRGEIYRANLNPVQGHEQGGARPVLIISHDVFNERSGTVIAMAITSQAQRAGYPLTYRLPANLLPRESWVKISQVRTISTERLGDRLSSLAESEVDHIVSGLVQLVG
jgi:mRNA interferase MazF